MKVQFEIGPTACVAAVAGTVSLLSAVFGLWVLAGPAAVIAVWAITAGRKKGKENPVTENTSEAKEVKEKANPSPESPEKDPVVEEATPEAQASEFPSLEKLGEISREADLIEVCWPGFCDTLAQARVSKAAAEKAVADYVGLPDTDGWGKLQPEQQRALALLAGLFKEAYTVKAYLAVELAEVEKASSKFGVDLETQADMASRKTRLDFVGRVVNGAAAKSIKAAKALGATKALFAAACANSQAADIQKVITYARDVVAKFTPAPKKVVREFKPRDQQEKAPAPVEKQGKPVRKRTGEVKDTPKNHGDTPDATNVSSSDAPTLGDVFPELATLN